MHKQTLYSACTTACDAHANSRTRHTKTRLEATLPFRTLEMQLQFSLHAGLFTSGGMLPSAKAHAYARPIHAHLHYPVYDMHMHICTRCTLYTCACRTAQNPCQKRASLMQHCMVAASRVDPIWPKLVFSATADCALHPYVSTTYRRPIPRTRKQGRVFARRRRKIWKLGSETVEF